MADMNEYEQLLQGRAGKVRACYREDDPDCEFRWLNDEVIEHLGWRGFEPVKRHKDDPSPSPDSRVRWGDLFLCKRSQAVARASRKRKEDRMKKRRNLFMSGKMLEAATNRLSMASGVDIRGGGHYEEEGGPRSSGRPIEEIRERQEDLTSEIKDAGMDDLLEGDSSKD